jgi:hypothetical protein
MNCSKLYEANNMMMQSLEGHLSKYGYVKPIQHNQISNPQKGIYLNKCISYISNVLIN